MAKRRWYKLPRSGTPFYGVPPEGATLLARGPAADADTPEAPRLADQVERTAAAAAAGTEGEGEGEGQGTGPPRLLDLPVARIVDQLDGADVDTIERLLAEEQEGAARKGLIEQLERMRDNLTDTEG